MDSRREKGRKSGLAPTANTKQMLGFPASNLGQSYPQRCPQPGGSPEPLGSPLSIREAAKIIGCSAWTVRQRLIPLGLPVFRSGAGGKLIFYANQITRWIEIQQKGTM